MASAMGVLCCAFGSAAEAAVFDLIKASQKLRPGIFASSDDRGCSILAAVDCQVDEGVGIVDRKQMCTPIVELGSVDEVEHLEVLGAFGHSGKQEFV